MKCEFCPSLHQRPKKATWVLDDRFISWSRENPGKLTPVCGRCRQHIIDVSAKYVLWFLRLDAAATAKLTAQRLTGK